MTRVLQALLAVQGRVSYRRLLAWTTATVLLATGHLDAWAWVAVTGVFIGGDAAERVARIASGRGE
jgi:hypothetical protein